MISRVLTDLHHGILCTVRIVKSTPLAINPVNFATVTFAAASVLAAATLCPYLGLNFDRPPCKSSWEKALYIFSFHKAHVASAERGIEALERFKHYINTRGSATQSESGQLMVYLKHDSNTAITLVESSMGGDIRNAPPTDDSSSLASFMTFDADSAADTFTDGGFNAVPMDESWFASQDFYFDDTV